jgi:hypothetical protein
MLITHSLGFHLLRKKITFTSHKAICELPSYFQGLVFIIISIMYFWYILTTFPCYSYITIWYSTWSCFIFLYSYYFSNTFWPHTPNYDMCFSLKISTLYFILHIRHILTSWSSQDDSVSKMTSYGLDDQGLTAGRGTTSRLTLWLTQPSIQ